MHNWRILDDTYIYDGSIEGFLTVVSKSLKLKIIPQNIISEILYQDNLLKVPVFIETNIQESDRLLRLINNISNYSLNNIYISFLTEDEDKENIILKYIILLFKYGKNVDFMKSNEWIIKIEKMKAKVSKEAHRLKGFLRFEEVQNKVLYSKIEPENNIIEILAKHFSTRLKSEFWIIFDKRRHLAAIYNKQSYSIININELNFNLHFEADEEKLYRKLWKDYFENISIKERKNLRCQMNFMPKKYWKYLTEMKGD